MDKMKTRVRFPNESFPIDIPNFKWDEFKTTKIFDSEVFGWWGNIYVSVNRQDYEKQKNKMKVLDAHSWLQKKENKERFPNASYLPDIMEAYAKYYHAGHTRVIKTLKRKKPNDN
jgi:hypothetical protein